MDQQDAKRDVDAVQHDLQEQTVAGAAKTDEPAKHDIVGERQGRRQHAHVPIGPRRGLHRRAAADEALRDDDERHLQDDYREAEADRQDEGAIERRRDRPSVPCPQRLRHQAGGSGPQEVEGQEDDVEDQSADGNAANQRRVAEAADDAEADDADERRRQVGERHRQGDGEDASVGDGERLRRRTRGHGPLRRRI